MNLDLALDSITREGHQLKPPEKPKPDLAPVDRVISRNLNRVRKRRELTFKDLAERLAENGWRVPVIRLQRIENGKTGTGVADLVALAYVLQVSPMSLLVDHDAADSDDWYITPTVPVTIAHARDWIAGDWPAVDMSTPAASAAMQQFTDFTPPDKRSELWIKFAEKTDSLPAEGPPRGTV